MDGEGAGDGIYMEAFRRLQRRIVGGFGSFGGGAVGGAVQVVASTIQANPFIPIGALVLGMLVTLYKRNRSVRGSRGGVRARRHKPNTLLPR